MLFLLICLPLCGGILCWIVSTYIARQVHCLARISKAHRPKNASSWRQYLTYLWIHQGTIWIALVTLIISIGITLYYWQGSLLSSLNEKRVWAVNFDVSWIPFLGIRFHLLLDGLTLIFVMLSLMISLFTVLFSYKKQISSNGLFYFFILWCTSSAIGLFTAYDLFLFFLFWEMVTIPVYFLIVLWGRRDSNSQLRFNGAVRLVIFTQLSGLLMLISIISLALINFTLSGEWTFDYAVLIHTPISYYVEFILMLGFLIAFIVRIPIIPFHGGFIDAHIESSTITSMILSSFLTNTAIYGILRFVVPIFPNASITIAPVIILIGLVSVYYASLLIFDQSDIKKLIAYLHIVIMNFLLAMVFMGKVLSFQGIVIQSIANTILIIGLFMLGGILATKYRTRNIDQFIRLGGLTTILSAFAVFFILIVIGVPGTANFIGNLMLFFAGFGLYPIISVLLISGLLLATLAMLVRLQPVFYRKSTIKKGSVCKVHNLLSWQDTVLFVLLIVILFIVGIFPQFILDTSYPVLEQIAQFWKNSQIIAFKLGT